MRNARLALAVAGLLLAPSMAHADEIVPGVLSIGWTHRESHPPNGTSNETQSGDPEHHVDPSNSHSCLLWNPFNGTDCIGPLDEHRENERENHSSSSTRSTESGTTTEDDADASAAGGAAGVGSSSTTSDHHATSSHEDDNVDYTRTYYSNNYGYYEEHEYDLNRYHGSGDASSNASSSTSATGAHADSAAGGAALGASSSRASGDASSREESRGSNATGHRYFETPFYGTADDQERSSRSESRSFRNSTDAGTTAFLVSPLDASRLQILGVTFSKGNDHASGSSESHAHDGDATLVGGGTLFGNETTRDEHGAYDTSREWLRLVMDLQDGTVAGSVSSSRGSDSGWSGSSETSSHTFGGVAFGDGSSDESSGSHAWRDAQFTLSALQGYGSLSVRSWDNAWQNRSVARDEPVRVGGSGIGREDASGDDVTSDGLGIGFVLDKGQILWLGAAYENRTEDESGSTDVLVNGQPEGGIGTSDASTSRSAAAAGGSGALGTSASARSDEATHHHEQGARAGGSDLIRGTSHDEHVTRQADASALNGILTLHLLYEDGNSTDRLDTSGAGLGSDKTYRRFVVETGGSVPGVDNSPLVVYDVGESQSAADTTYFGSEDVLRTSENTTATHARVTVLPNLPDAVAQLLGRDWHGVGVDASHEWEETRVYDGKGHEGIDEMTHTFGAEASGGVVSAGVSGSLDYLELLDRNAVWLAGSVQPSVDGVPIPDTTPLTGGLGDAGVLIESTKGVALALVFGGVPVFVPLFEADPNFLVLSTHALAFEAAGSAGSVLPEPAQGPYAAVVTTARDGSLDAYDTFVRVYEDDLGRCWCNTIPDEARASFALDALGAATAATAPPLAQAVEAYDAVRAYANARADEIMGVDTPFPSTPAPPPDLLP